MLLIIVLYIQLIAVVQSKHLPFCPPKCSCFQTTVRCVGLQLNEIPEVPSETEILDIRRNRIKKLNADRLSGLKNLHSLFLNNNEIDFLDANAFIDLQRLQYLYLFKNKLTSIDSSIFQGLRNLKHLYLQQNQIQEIEAKAFGDLLSLKRLLLQGNRLTTVRRDWFPDDFSRFHKLGLYENPLNCDCNVKWILELNEKLLKHVFGKCSEPQELLGRQLNTLKIEDIQCMKPKLIEEPEGLKIVNDENEKVMLNCKAMGLPKPTITWYHNQLQIDGEAEFEEKFAIVDGGSASGSLSTLVIKGVTDDTQGVYECMAKNSMGEAMSQQAMVKMMKIFKSDDIDEEDEDIIEDLDDDYDSEEQVDMVKQKMMNNANIERGEQVDAMKQKTMKNANIDSEEQVDVMKQKMMKNVDSELNSISQSTAVIKTLIGSRITIDCMSKSGGRKVNWKLKNKKTVKMISDEDERHSILPNGSLHLRNAMPIDSGIYICDGNSDRMQVLQVQVPPAFSESPESIVEVKAGDPLRLICRATGIPQPSIRWMHIDRRIEVGVGEKYAFAGVEAIDEGNYECVAENEVGSAAKVFRIKVAGGTIDTKALSSVRKSFVNDYDVVEAVKEAKMAVDQAINKTLDYVRNKGRIQSPGRLLQIARFPLAPESIEAGRAVEIYERSLEILRRKSESEGKVEAANFTYDNFLSTNQLNILNHLTGCLVGSRESNSLTFANCKAERCFHENYRTYDGSCNNFDNPLWGAAQTPFYRLLPPAYEDGLFLPVGWLDNKLYHGFKKPNPREVTLKILSTKTTSEDADHSHMLMQWGQFLDHDMDFSMPSISLSTFDRLSVDCSRICSKLPPCFSIQMTEDDPRRNRPHLNRKMTSNVRCIEFIRSSSYCGSGLTSVASGTLMYREQLNQLSSFIDGSQIYGSLPALTIELRHKLPRDNGLMRTTEIDGKAYLPFNLDDRWPNDCHQDPRFSEFGCFLAGDIRSNEQLGLSAMHTLWVREHNRIAKQLQDINSHWDGEKVFQETRKIVGAMLQHITYDHWLRFVLGKEGMSSLGSYKSYNSTVNPSISNVFATAALRFGHTIINPFLLRLNESYMPPMKYKSHLKLHEQFFAPHLLVREGGIGPILRGLLFAPTKQLKADEIINSELTEHLFEMAKHVSLDLASINVQRGRDHGLPDYNEWRKFCGLKVAETFDDLKNEIKSKLLREKLRKMYGHPSNVDLFVGGVSEDPLPDAKVGPTFRCLLVDQFKRVRDGDRFWYENRIFSDEQMSEIKKSSLAKVICDNGDNTNTITKDVFVVPSKQQFVNCKTLPSIDLMKWKSSSSTSTTLCNDGDERSNFAIPSHVLQKFQNG